MASGFLSENAEFVTALHAARIVFVGPSPETLTDFGLKHRARELAVRANVPVVPGTGMLSDSDDVVKLADNLGYPVSLTILSSKILLS